MTWKKKSKKGKNRYYSVAKELKKKKKITPQFEIMLNSLTLEELIALKLELAAKAAGGALYGIPIWKSLRRIVSDAVLKFAFSATATKMEAANFLGIKQSDFHVYTKDYETEKFFTEENPEMD